MPLPQEIFESIVDLLKPHVQSEAERRALFEAAFHDEVALKNQIEWQDSAYTFSYREANRLLEFGECTDKRYAIDRLLKALREKVGVKGQKHIDVISTQLNEYRANEQKKLREHFQQNPSPYTLTTVKNVPTIQNSKSLWFRLWTKQDSRSQILERIKRSWIEGVLYPALRDVKEFEIPLEITPQAVLRQSGITHQLASTSNIWTIFHDSDECILILGDPGTGKTILLLQLAELLIQKAEDKNIPESEKRIPVVFNLASWAQHRKPLKQWLVLEFKDFYHIHSKTVASWLNEHDLILLLDGLDEVKEEVREECIEAINQFRKEHISIRIVVASRVEDYYKLRTQLDLENCVTLRPLTQETINVYLAEENAVRVKQRKPDLSGLIIALSKDYTLRDMATVPFLLNTMIFTYKGKSASQIGIYDDPSERRERLFKHYIELRLRKNTSPYTYDQTLRTLKWLATKMQAYTQTVFRPKDIQLRWLDKKLLKYYRLGWGALWLISIFTISISLLLPLHILLFTWTSPAIFFVGWAIILLCIISLYLDLYFDWNIFLISTVILGHLFIGGAPKLIKLLGYLLIIIIFVILCLVFDNILDKNLTIYLVFAIIIAITILVELSFYNFALASRIMDDDEDYKASQYFTLYTRLYLYIAPRLGRNALIPFNLNRFLDLMAKHSIIRPLSGGYVFQHRYLLEALAGKDEISRLIEEINSNNDEIRDNAIIALIKIGRPALQKLIDAHANSKHPSISKILIVLSKMFAHFDTELLISLLRNTDKYIRREVVIALEKREDSRAIEAWIGALNDPSLEVRQEVILGLGNIGGEEAIDLLLTAINDPINSVRSTVAYSLGKIGGERAIEALIALIHDPSQYVGAEALDNLGKIGGEQAIETLLKELNSPNREIYKVAAFWLGEMQEQRAFMPLINILNNPDVDNNIQIASIRALGKLGKVEAVEYLIPKLQIDPYDEYQDMEKTVIGATIKALGKLGGKDAIEALSQLLTEEFYFAEITIGGAAALELKAMETFEAEQAIKEHKQSLKQQKKTNIE